MNDGDGDYDIYLALFNGSSSQNSKINQYMVVAIMLQNLPSPRDGHRAKRF